MALLRSIVRCSSALTPVRTSLLHATTRSYVTKLRKVTLIPGDGIGPECCSSVTGVLAAADVPIEWERFDHLGHEPLELQEVISSISRNGVALKGPLYTPTDSRTPQSRNMQLRKALDLYANVVPVKHVKGIATRHSEVHIDFVVIRENTEGEYTGIEHEISPGVVESLKIITTDAATRIAERAFDYAVKNNRKKVTAVHKANIQKLSDGEFLRACREVAKNFPSMQYEEMIVDNCTMQLAMRPQQFDVMVTPNLYGAIVTNIASALVGGPGLLAGANVGKRGAIFESGARHVGGDLAGKNQANPVGTLFAAIMMLRHLGMDKYAERIERAVRVTVERDRVCTPDVGGTATTRQVTHAVIQNL